MSSVALDRLQQQVTPTVPASQAAAVEHTRAAAEVAAAVQAARMVPRDPRIARERMRVACSEYGLAKRAFYTYEQSGETIHGPTVQLARELAAIWGNVDYGTAELARRDGEAGREGESEIRAWAWDQETNTRKSRTVIVPHVGYVGRKRRELTEMRAIDQNNSSVAGRAEREALMAILPKAFMDEAQSLCRTALERGDGTKTIQQRAAEAVEAYAKGGVTKAQLEAKVNRPVEKWTAQDCADFEVLYESLRRREITKDEAFPQQRVTASDITGHATHDERLPDPYDGQDPWSQQGCARDAADIP